MLVIGSSNSAGDVATELAGAASKVLISRRRGVIIAPRISHGTYRPNDVTLTRRFDAIVWTLTSFAPAYMAAFIARMMRTMIAKGWGNRIKPEWNLKTEDAASISFQAPMVTDTIVPLLEANKVGFISGVQRITEDGKVELHGGEIVSADAIIFCTGYSIDTRLAGPVERSSKLQLPRLYHNVYHPEYPDSLAYLTFWFTIAGIYELGDLAAMGIAQVFAGRYKLPDRGEMERSIDASHIYVNDLASRVPQPISLQSAARCVDRGVWVTFLHEAAGTDAMRKLGYGVEGWKFWLQDRAFCHLLMTGVNSIHTSRLFEGRPGSRKQWGGAKRAILEANEDLKRVEEDLRRDPQFTKED